MKQLCEEVFVHTGRIFLFFNSALNGLDKKLTIGPVS